MTKNLADELQRTARAALAGLQPTASGDEVGGLSFMRLLAAAFRARYLLFATTLFGVLVGTFLAITKPNNYVSTGTFRLTGIGAEKVSADSTRSAETSLESIATGATYILSGDELLQRVVNRLGAARILAPYQPGGPEDSGVRAMFFEIQRNWNATREEDRTPEEALKRLKRTVSVERPRYTEMLLATCSANNPKLAQEILTVFMEEAIKLHIEKYDDTRAYDAAKSSFEAAEAKRKAITNTLREFLERKAHVEDFDMELTRLKKDFADSANEVSKLETSIQVKLGTLQSLEAKLVGPNAIPKQVQEELLGGLDNEALKKRRDEVDELKIKLSGLRASLTQPDDPEVVALQKRIAAIERFIKDESEIARTAKPQPVWVPNKAYQLALDDKIKTQSELETAQLTLKLTKEMHEKRVSGLRLLQGLEPEFTSLRAERVTAETTEAAMRINWEVWQQKRALGQGNFSSLANVGSATLPLEKEGPDRGKLLLGGFFVGLFFGLGIVVLRALPDRVVRTREDLEGIEGLAVIGAMPRLDNTNLRRHVALREQGW